ncbi:MAG: GNAT family N-acetyltransferase [Bauldia sp.]
MPREKRRSGNREPPKRPARLTFRPVTTDNRGDFERLFASPGAPKHCWCMVWRRTPEEAKHNDGGSRKRQMLKRIGAGVPVGLLAYAGGEPVGWVSVAPRASYRDLGGQPAEEAEAIWSIVCFFLPRRLRGQGTVRRLIAAAVDHARGEGATLVEAYPVDEDAPSYRFMGFVSVFAEAGFTEVGRAGARRHVMRLETG